jgi:hypothetical protein
VTEFEIDELARAIAKELHERQMRQAAPPSSEPANLADSSDAVDLDFDA